MPKYTVVLSKSAEKQLDKLSNHVIIPISEAIYNLEINPRPSGCKKLKNRTGYRIRIGNLPCDL